MSLQCDNFKKFERIIVQHFLIILAKFLKIFSKIKDIFRKINRNFVGNLQKTHKIYLRIRKNNFNNFKDIFRQYFKKVVANLNY